MYLPTEYKIEQIIKGLEDGTDNKSVPNYQPTPHRLVTLELFLPFVFYKDLMMD